MSEFDCGWIEVKRSSQYANRMRAIEIFVDDKSVGKLANGESKVFEVMPGEHRVYAKIDWCKTPEISVSVDAGETATLKTGSELVGWKIFLAIVYLFMPSKWIYLCKS